MIEKHDLYEACVQSPPEMTLMLRAIHGDQPRIWARTSRAPRRSRHWVANVPESTAVAVDLDEGELGRSGETPGVRSSPTSGKSAIRSTACSWAISRSDTCTRDEPWATSGTRKRMNAGGVFVCDTTAASPHITSGVSTAMSHCPAGCGASTAGEQQADPLTAMVTDVLHFRVFDVDEVVADFPDAYVYRWRLWSVPSTGRDGRGRLHEDRYLLEPARRRGRRG